MAGWTHFPHEADVGIRGYGPTLDAAFEQAAVAMVAAITDIEKIIARECVPISCEAPQADLLLVEWLNAVLYEMATRHMIFGRFSVTIKNCKLSAMAWGEHLSLERHRPAAEVKGATYTALEVSRHCDGQWHAQCVVDV
jgi:tRNA nucleotidyltransferase (CCA-adding enzyme)